MNYLFVMPKNSAKSPGGYNVFAIGIAYVSSYLKSKGFSVYTSNLEFDERCTYDALEDLVNANNIDVVGVSGLSRDYPRVKEVVDAVKLIDRSVLMIVGGGIVSGDPEAAMEALGADIGVIGPGEETMAELASKLDSREDFSQINGLIYRRSIVDQDIPVIGGKFLITDNRKKFSDLDDIPFPDYEGFSYEDFLKQTNYRSIYIFSSRSCPFKCTFCFHPSGEKYRKRSLDHIFNEIDYVLDKFGNGKITTVAISDELFAPRKDRVIDFCKRIEPYGIRWSCQLRVCDVDEELLKLMKESGCHTVSYGIESMDDRVLDSMNKKINTSQIKKALELTRKVGIEIQGGLIFGDVEETIDTVDNSIEWYDQHPHYGLELNMIQIFPGTPLYEYACNNNIIRDKVQFLLDGCPQVNVSRMSDERYKEIAASIYFKNMTAVYEPDELSVRCLDMSRESMFVNGVCNHCGSEIDLEIELLHRSRVKCEVCNQRYYIDSFDKLEHDPQVLLKWFEQGEKVAIWGSGEVCIKMLSRYDLFLQDNFLIVDKSLSRQGVNLFGKDVLPPECIVDGVRKIIISVPRRKGEIISEIKKMVGQFEVLVPVVVNDSGRSFFSMEDISYQMIE